jgi:hypothetical protein
MALKLKLDDKGFAILADGKDGVKLPVYIDDVDGKELPYDVNQLHNKIIEVNGESKTRRLKIEELEGVVRKFGSITPEVALTIHAAVNEVGGLDGLTELKKKVVNIDALKTAMEEGYNKKHAATIEGFEAKLAEATKGREEDAGLIRSLMIGGQFQTSPFVNKKTLLPPDIAEKTFGHHFRVEGKQVIPYYGDEKIISRKNPGETPDFEEAIEYIVGKYAQKDRILVGTGASGSGAGNGNVNNNSNSKVMKRDAFMHMNPNDQMVFSKAGGRVED